jgi:hypothetical protein
MKHFCTSLLAGNSPAEALHKVQPEELAMQRKNQRGQIW